MGCEKSQEQKGGHRRGTEKQQQSSLCFIDGLVSEKELEPQFQKYKGRVVLRSDIVKDDSGASAVFTEQSSTASQMTAAKVMDVIAPLPDCDGQATDAVSVYTQVKMEGAQKILKIPNSRMSGFLDTSSKT